MLVLSQRKHALVLLHRRVLTQYSTLQYATAVQYSAVHTPIHLPNDNFAGISCGMEL